MGESGSFENLRRYRAAVSPLGSSSETLSAINGREVFQSLAGISCAGPVDGSAEGGGGLCWLWLEKSTPSIS